MDMSEIARIEQKTFVLPGNLATDAYLLPVSGGADSTYLAILLHKMFPTAPFQMVFTDTGAEEPEILTTLDKLEAFLGKPITRIQPELGLYELIEKFGGYLPSPNARWCTRELKLKSFQRWIQQFDGIQKWMFVGIRADEPSRIAFTLDQVETVMPYVDLQMCREDVFAGLQRTIGIPRFYQRRTRSGCSVCPFKRRSELVGLLQQKPIEFDRGMKYEKLSEEDRHRHDPAVPLWKDSGIASNWLSLPLPEKDTEMSGKKAKANDLFGNRGLFVGGEFFFDGFPGGEAFVWHQRLVSYSPTLHGIKQQLDDRFRHLLATAEVFEMSPDDVRHKAKFAIWYVELPSHVFDPAGPTGEGYTWHQGESYAQMRHVVQWMTRALQAEHQKQEAAKTPRSMLSVQYEWAESAKVAINAITEEVGAVVDSTWYAAKEEEPADLEEEEMLATLPCPMCHL